MKNISIFPFHRDFGSPFTLKDVMYVLGLNNILASYAMLEYHGYNVIFSTGNAFLRHTATRKVNKIGV